MNRTEPLLFVALVTLAGCGSATLPDTATWTPTEVPADAPPRPSSAPSVRRPRTPRASDAAADGIAIEQDGAPVAIENHEARVARRAFTIIARIQGGGRAAVFGTTVGLYVNASFDRRLFDLALHGEPLPVGDGEVFGEGSGMAESSPIEPTLLLTDAASHYWYWSEDVDRRCERFERDGDDLLCRRSIEEVYDVETGVSQRLSSVKSPALHVVTLQRPSKTALGYVRLKFDPL